MYLPMYIEYKVWAHSDQNWIFYEFLKLLKIWTKVPVL